MHGEVQWVIQNREDSYATRSAFPSNRRPRSLQIETIDVPPPGAGEVRIAVKALGLNRAESMFRLGQYLEQPTFPARLGYEAAGTVEAVGPGVRA